MWRWVSIMPGMTMPSEASISAVPSGTSSPGPTPAISSPTTSTSASRRMSCASFMVSTVPPRSTTGRPASISLNVGSSPSPARHHSRRPVARSRNEHELRPALGAALALPGLLDLREWERLDVDGDVAGGDVAREVEEALPALLGRREVDAEPAQVERDRPQRRGGQRDRRPGDVADLHVAGVPAGGLDRRDRRVAPQGV